MLGGSPTRIVVVGGGVSGLSAAFRLCAARRDAGPAVRLFEAAVRCGGQIRTDQDSGVLLEGGPDSVLDAKPTGRLLCRQIGLEGELIDPRPDASGMEIVRGGRLVRLPKGLSPLGPSRGAAWLGSPVLSWPGKLRVLAERFVRAAPSTSADESVRAFATRRFGRELCERVVEPILGGLYTADVGTLSADVVLPRLREVERRHGSLTGRSARAAAGAGATGRAARTVFSLQGGMQTLVERLVERLPLGCIARAEGVEGLTWDASSGTWWVRTGATPGLRAEAVVLACPADESARLVHDTDPQLAALLGRLRYASCATVSLVYPRTALGRSPSSYGFFVPRVERLPILACSYSSLKFEGRAPQDRTLLRVFLGGALHERLLERDDAALGRLAHETLRGLLSVAGAPMLARVHRSPASMPQFEVGDAERRRRIGARLEHLPGLFVCGSAVGAYGIPDCIDSGARAAENALDHVQRASCAHDMAHVAGRG